MKTSARREQKARNPPDAPSAPARSAKLGPVMPDGSRLLTITVGRARADYWLTEFGSPLGRSFRLERLPACFGGEVYWCLLASEQDLNCDCKGFTFRPEVLCKHLASLIALITHGKL